MSDGLDLTTQLVWNRMLAMVEEQAQTLIRTAFSSMVRECGDLSAGVFDLEGKMLAAAFAACLMRAFILAKGLSLFWTAFFSFRRS